MARDLDDDAPRRKQDADELTNARERDADERIYVVTTNLVIDAQEELARRRLDRVWHARGAMSWLSLLTAVGGTLTAAVTTGDLARFVLRPCVVRIRVRPPSTRIGDLTLASPAGGDRGGPSRPRVPVYAAGVSSARPNSSA
ncbi:hypothetical protein ACGFOU_13720 [Streptomyces sp. NPDC048595]|uniref:hypothetical protein n=1 Tax=Streptomyces sp. NPDC048595 TaxID=3365576 RepID=UPI003715EECE